MKLLRNRLLVGGHSGPDYEAEPDKDGKYPTKRYKFVNGQPAPIVKDIVNLEHKCGSDKFRCLDGAPKIAQPKVKLKAPPVETDIEVDSDTLANMSPEELVQMATDYGLTLDGTESAEELREKLRETA